MFIGTPVRLTATPDGSIQGVLLWASGDASKATVVADPGGLTAIATPLAEGPVVFTVTEPTRDDSLPPATGTYNTVVRAAHATQIAIAESPISNAS